MNRFAKLYETEETQIVVMLGEGEEGPEVRFFFQPNGLGVCSVAACFSGDEEGNENAEEFFMRVDQAMAKRMVTGMIQSIRGNPADDSEEVNSAERESHDLDFES